MDFEVFDRRTVTLSGPLDEAKALQVSAELMLLDGTGDDAVRLVVDSAGGTIDGALMLIDVLDLLGVPVNALCMGRADGAALCAFVVASHRSVGPHALLRLDEPAADYARCARDVRAAADHHRARLDQLLERMAAATGQPVERIGDDLARGRFLRPEEAVEQGFADEILTRGAQVLQFPRQVGFRLR